RVGAGQGLVGRANLVGLGTVDPLQVVYGPWHSMDDVLARMKGSGVPDAGVREEVEGRDTLDDGHTHRRDRAVEVHLPDARAEFLPVVLKVIPFVIHPV